MNEYNGRGLLIHEDRASDGERLDQYLARVQPEIGDAAFWYAECDANRVEIRDYFSPVDGMYNGERWFVRWYDGTRWRRMDLPEGERPRMRDGYCHIVKE